MPPESDGFLAGNQKAEVMSRVQPHELLPSVDTQVVKHWVVFDWASEGFGRSNGGDAFIDQWVIVLVGERDGF